MLIYNYKKEFLGIDEKDLQALGFQNLQGLQREVNDFADLFVKTPGYVHNFKHVHWIDFITCAESNEESKVIINVNNKNYKAIVQINTTFPVDNPTSKAYIVHLSHLRELTIKEGESISGDIVERQAPVTMTQTPTIVTTANETLEQEEVNVDAFDTVVETSNVTIDPYEAPLDIDMDDDEDEKLAVEIEDEDEDFTEELTTNFEEDLTLNDVQKSNTLEEIKTQTVQENFDNGYTYDPSVASDELGLPLDLIEEFIQDFIAQAKDFKDDLYIAIDNGDLDNLKILSHKLKGVAANLRIEDALETLTTANTSSDLNIIKENLDTFYNIVAKLAGEEISIEKEVLPEEVPVEEIVPVEVDEDTLNLDFKEDDLYSDPIEVDDSAEEEKIEIPELADNILEEDEFTLASDIELELEDITEDDAPIIEAYDKEQVAVDIGLDIASFNELFEDYLAEAKELIEALNEAINGENLSTCKNEALKLKGMSDNMRISSFSEALETLINSSDIQELKNALDSIKTALAAL